MDFALTQEQALFARLHDEETGADTERSGV